MPWSIFEVTFGVECKPKSSTEFVDTQIGQYAVIREEKKRRFILPADRDPDYVPVSRERAKTSTGQVMVTRCGKETFKFCLCHTLNSASWHAVYGPAFAMYTYCFNNQVDFIMGDGNQHYQFSSKSHKTKVKARGSEGDTQNCLFNQMLRGFVSKVNSGVDFAQRIYYTIIDNNPIENQESQEDLDCVFCHILGWGKQTSCHDAREKIQSKVSDLINKYRPGWTKASSVLYFHANNLTEEDRNYLADHSDGCHPTYGPRDYHVSVSERVKHLTRGDLWLGDHDNDWHLPLLFTVREFPLRNMRARTEEGWDHTLAKQSGHREKVRAEKEAQEAKKAKAKAKGKGQEKGTTVTRERAVQPPASTAPSARGSYTTWQQENWPSQWWSWDESNPTASSSSSTWRSAPYNRSDPPRPSPQTNDTICPLCGWVLRISPTQCYMCNAWGHRVCVRRHERDVHG